MSSESSFNVTLLDERGNPSRRVNIMTEAGANAFLSGGIGTNNSISKNLRGMEQLRRDYQNTNLSRVQRKQLEDKLMAIYVMFGVLAEFASPKIFAEQVPTSQHEAIIQHTRDVLVKLTKDPTYIQTGVLNKVDQECLDILIPSTRHTDFVKALRKTDLLQVLADFCKAAKPPAHGMPGALVSDAISIIAKHVRIGLMKDEKLPDEKIFKILETSGFLGQCLRCMTQPGPKTLHQDAGMLDFFDKLQGCSTFIQKRLKEGTPTGDILSALVTRCDGYKGLRPEQVTARLTNLLQMANVGKGIDRDAPMGGQLKFCRKCNRNDLSEEFQSSLKVCSRCKQTYYCSKECQISDWKDHKCLCKPYSSDPAKAKRLEKKVASNQQLMFEVLNQCDFDIMLKLKEVEESTGVPKKDLVVELDFEPDSETGSAPILSRPPQFNIAPAVEYYSGDRPAEPDWFFKGTDVHEKIIRPILLGLEDHHKRMTGDHLLVLARWPDGDVGVYRTTTQDPTTLAPLFGDQAYEGFKKFVDGDDDHALDGILSEQLVQKFGVRRENEPDTDPEMIERARQALRAFGADF